jgi:hypothetical protein
LQNTEVKSGSTTCEKSFHHIRSPKPNPKFVAGQAGLCHHQVYSADVKAIPDVHFLFSQSSEREIFTKDA